MEIVASANSFTLEKQEVPTLISFSISTVEAKYWPWKYTDNSLIRCSIDPLS